MEKKTKLTISGSAKKSIKNIEIARTQGKHSVVIEKSKSNFQKKGSSFRGPGSNTRKKTAATFNRGAPFKSSFETKTPPITNDFERRKLAEQRATTRLKGDSENKDKKTLKAWTKKRELKLTVSRALSDEIDAKQRSLASDELTGGYDVVKGERVKIQGYLEDFALSKEEADELIMSARNIVYKDWVMRYGEKNKINNFRLSQKINQEHWDS